MTRALSPIRTPILQVLDDSSNTTAYTTIDEEGFHHLECDLCKMDILLTRTGNISAMQQHRGRKRCTAEQAARAGPSGASTSAEAPATTARGRAAATNPRSRLFHPYREHTQSRSPSVQPSVSAIPSRSSSTHPHRDRAHMRDQLYSRSPSVSSSRPRSTPVADPPVSEDDLLDFRRSDCPGVSIEWTAGSVLATYPFQLHTFHEIGWEPLSFDKARNTITLRSAKCHREPKGPETNPCDACAIMRTGKVLRAAVDRAQNAPKGTPYEYLNARQMKKMLDDFSRTMRRLRSQVHNLKQQLAGAQKKLDDYGRIMMLLSKGDVPGLRRILAASLRHGSSPLVIINLLERALKGLYRARGGFSSRDLDIAFLAKALGGPKLLYALQKAFGVASDTTLRREKKIPVLTPSSGIPTTDDVNANIDSFCHPDINPPDPTKTALERLVGNTLMADGVALETRCTYCEKGNRVLGTCREHGHRVDTIVRDIQSVEKIRKAIFEPASDEEKVCIGPEATVVAWASYHPTQYDAFPLVASPCCKTESAEAMRLWMKKSVVKAWRTNPSGEATHGPFWTWATDGDAVFRLAKHLECIEHGVKVDITKGFGARLKDIEGLNLFVSVDGIVGSCDPKHIFKRFATLLRNPTGFMVEETNIKASDVLKYLSMLEGMTPEAARELLNPADKQNVPKAVALLQHLNRLSETPDAGLLPAEQHRRNILIFLGKFFYLFVEPFINVQLSLSEQLERLSAFSHISAALYLRHGTAFLTGALYADTQSVIKSIVITIARMQDISEDLVLHILQEGTDRLERLFCETRVQDHNSNYDIKQFCEKAAIAALIHAAYARNPDLNRGHRKISLTGALGIDHVNAQSWIGSARVGNVQIGPRWLAGRSRAVALLKKYLPPSFPIPDFSSLWRVPGRDLLRPNGVYVGTRKTADDVRSEDEEVTPVPSSQPVSAASAPLPSAVAGDEPSLSGETLCGDDAVTEAEESAPMDILDEPDADNRSESAASMASAEADTDLVGNPGIDLPSRLSVSDLRDMAMSEPVEDEDIPIGFDLEDCLPAQPETSAETPSFDSLPSASSEREDPKSTKMLTYRGKLYYKSSIVASFLSSKWSKKYTDRLLRVRGMAKGEFGKAGNNFDDSNLTENQVKCGDLAGVLLLDASTAETVEKTFALAVIEISGFIVQGSSSPRSAIDFADLDSSKTKVTGQVLELKYSRELSDWDWTGHYLRIGSSSRSAALETRKHYVLEVNGALVFPLSPRTVPYRGAEQGVSLTTTWRLATKDLANTSREAWLSLNPETEEIIANIDCLPLIYNGEQFPYRDDTGVPHFTVEKLPPQLKAIEPAKRSNTNVTCYLCGAGMKLAAMVEHVGRHIIHASRYPDSPETLANQPGVNPCGFCGRDGCFNQLKKVNKKSLTIVSTCPLRRSKMQPSKRLNIYDPEHRCSNTLIHCSLCPKTASNDPRTIWRYNASYHIASEHPQAAIPPPMLVSMFISKREEEAMGIDEETTNDFRRSKNLLASDDVAMLVDIAEGDAETQGRGRSKTIVGHSK